MKAALALAALLTVPLAGAAEAAPRTLGFSIVNFSYAMSKQSDAEDCPQGFAATGIRLFLAAQSAAERERLLRAENAKELARRALYTAGGVDHCVAWAEVPRAPQHSPQGKISRGFNLDGTTDGAATANSCAHEKFVGPNGEPGIDNQAYRLVGCVLGFRGQQGERYGFMEAFKSAGVKDGITTLLLEVTGVDDLRNDPDVAVGFYVGTDSMPIDAAGGVLPDASLSVLADPLYQSVLKGRIADGVLETEPGAIAFYYDYSGTRREIHLRAGRLRLTLAPDGGARGLLAGYVDVADFDPPAASAKAERVELGGYDCPSYRQAIRRHADGFPGPDGKCTALSAVYDIEAVPAFVIHPAERRSAEHQTAGADSLPTGR